MPLAAARPSSAAERRQRALGAYLDELREQCAASPATLAAVRAENSSLALDPWAARRLREAFFDGALDPGIPGLVAQGVALRLKCLVDRARLAGAAGNDTRKLYSAEAELMLDLGLGLALSRELQRAVDDAVREGGAPRAKELARFHHDLRSSISDVKKKIAEAEHERAESLSDNLTDQPKEEPRRPAGGALDRAACEAGLQYERQRLSRLRRALSAAVGPSRTEILVVLLAMAVALWLAVVSLPKLVSSPPDVVTLDDLPSTGVIVEIAAPPPTLYAVVDADAWNDLEESRRRRVISALSAVLLTHGYVGALLRTTDGKPVAQWLSGRGVEMTEGEEAVREDPRHTEPNRAATGSRR